MKINLDMIPVNGWYSLEDYTFTMTKYTSSTRTIILICDNSSISNYLSEGIKIKFKHNGYQFYGFVTKVTDNSIYIYIYDNGAVTSTTVSVTDVYFSNIAQPLNFPIDEANWLLLWSTTVTESNTVSTKLIKTKNYHTKKPIGTFKVGFTLTAYCEGSGGNILYCESVASNTNTYDRRDVVVIPSGSNGSATRLWAVMTGKNQQISSDTEDEVYLFAKYANSFGNSKIELGGTAENSTKIWFIPAYL